MTVVKEDIFSVEKEIADSFAVARHLDTKVEDASFYRITYNRIFLLQKGAGDIRIDDTLWPVKESTLLLLAKGQVFSFLPGAVYTGYELSFGDCFWEKAPASASNCKAVLFNDVEKQQQLPLQYSDLAALEELFLTLQQEYDTAEYTNKIDVMAAYLKIIMIKIANINSSLQRTDTYENQVFRRFKELVATHYLTTHEVADYAEMLGVNARKLTDLCKQCGGEGAKHIINQQIIAEAKRALQFSLRPVKEIAFQLSFSTPDQFSRFFKKYTGIPPNEYRDRLVKIAM